MYLFLDHESKISFCLFIYSKFDNTYPYSIFKFFLILNHVLLSKLKLFQKFSLSLSNNDSYFSGNNSHLLLYDNDFAILYIFFKLQLSYSKKSVLTFLFKIK